MLREKYLNYIIEILSVCLAKNFSFYAFRNPNEEHIYIGVQVKKGIRNFNTIDQLENLKGFVLCPFDISSSKESLFINEDILFSSQNIDIPKLEFLKNSPSLNKHHKPDEDIYISDRDLYNEQISELISHIDSGFIDKAVLSRILIKKSDLSTIDVFLKMCNTYKDAYVFYVHIASSVSWMGASPEKLLSYNGECLKTMALAATRKIKDNNISAIEWNAKELNEQALVSQYIEDIFDELEINKYSRKGPSSSRAGSLVHLKTEYIIENKFSVNQISNIISKLHPTPAVCGLPKEKAMMLIKQIEKHEREYYAGYLGCVDKDLSCNLFVNLRSMKIINNGFAIYVGGGITKQSKAEKEWLETCYKSEILLNSL